MGLTVLRLLLAPVLVWLVYAGAPGVVFAGVVLVAFVSDYFDGVIARRLGVASAELRHFDSRADLVFYATAAWAVWRLHSDVVRSVAIPALIVVGLDVIRHIFDFAKFGRDVAYHAWSSKVWGLSLALALVLLMASGSAGPS
jgi:phosphatidylglycerophosphate synthase